MTDELKGFEPVATVRIWNESNFCKDRWVYEFVGEKFENFGAGEYKLYTADQLAQVVQQRDELLAVLKEIANFEHPHCTTPQDLQAIAEATIAKVQP